MYISHSLSLTRSHSCTHSCLYIHPQSLGTILSFSWWGPGSVWSMCRWNRPCWSVWTRSGPPWISPQWRWGMSWISRSGAQSRCKERMRICGCIRRYGFSFFCCFWLWDVHNSPLVVKKEKGNKQKTTIHSEQTKAEAKAIHAFFLVLTFRFIDMVPLGVSTIILTNC